VRLTIPRLQGLPHLRPPSDFDKNVLEAVEKELEKRKVKVKEK